ncbi:zinc-dependent peptidase [Litoribacillus peritrichatus]|uniref:Zinc-dependent peptidase n=1 Tax=Litoribacillus peritrichatus TaxID=718191 RepID=A0ABP7MB74_9GAMM
MFQALKDFFSALFTKKPTKLPPWQPEWSAFLNSKVSFYRNLSNEDKTRFEQRCLLFLTTTSVEGGVAVEVTDQDKLLVAASAIIPVWGFPNWHYINIKTVYLLPAMFNEQFECGGPDARITGMVGTGPMAGKMALSKPALHQGFANDRDKQNVGIHEFVHLVDMADGNCDGFPERVKKFEYCAPWFDLVQHKISEVEDKKSNIREYATTNKAEFLAVASEYFFERPKMLQKKHPKLYEYLSDFYQQNLAEIEADIQPTRNSPCPCGSGKKYKRCCLNNL